MKLVWKACRHPIISEIGRSTTMAKSRDTRKDTKKKPAQTTKEKKKAKQEKKKNK